LAQQQPRQPERKDLFHPRYTAFYFASPLSLHYIAFHTETFTTPGPGPGRPKADKKDKDSQVASGRLKRAKATMDCGLWLAGTTAAKGRILADIDKGT